MKEINLSNNQNIKQLNNSYNKKLEKLTTLNTVLIEGLKQVQKLSFIR
jgi:hypothetical protein